MCADVHPEAFTSCDLYLLIGFWYKFYLEVSVVEIIGPIFCHKVDGNLGSDYRCKHSLMIQEEKNL